MVIPDNAYNKELTWSTSDSKIAIVDQDGNVTGCNEGNALITAKANDDSGVSVTCAVKVYTVKVSEISLSANQMNVKPGDLFNLTVSLMPITSSVSTIWRFRPLMGIILFNYQFLRTPLFYPRNIVSVP